MASILLVDDDPDILRIAGKLLSSQNHFVFAADDAIQALEYLNSKHVDLVISDANMPQYSGYDLIQTMKNHEEWKVIPIALLTARREKKDIEQAIRLGVVDYIVKPIDPHLFVQKIKALLKNHCHHTSLEIELAEANIDTLARMTFRNQILSISELGIDMLSPIEIPKGQRVFIDSHIFAEIGITPPAMVVQHCKKDPNDETQFRIKVQFFGSSDNILSKIRSWLVKRKKAKVS